MAVQHLRHAVTQAVIEVEVPSTGLSIEYLRMGWHPCDPPAPVSLSKDSRPPAEPVLTSPASPDDKNKE